jgi:hypothetical protein
MAQVVEADWSQPGALSSFLESFLQLRRVEHGAKE